METEKDMRDPSNIFNPFDMRKAENVARYEASPGQACLGIVSDSCEVHGGYHYLVEGGLIAR